MGLLKVIQDAPGYLKATFQGPQGSGKTRTAVELAAEAHKLFGSKKPIAFFDTETGSDYVADLIRDRTGMDSVRVKTRAFTDLMLVVRECIAGASDILIVDSITHVWRELQEAHMAAVNRGRSSPKPRMDLQDIMKIKKAWEPWPDLFLTSPVHIIVCGREGSEWSNEEDEQTGKRELVAVGKKMKVETEFGYEASLQVSMSARQTVEQRIKRKSGSREIAPREIINTATVLKDRFDQINGQVFEMPTGAVFRPHLDRLKPASHVPVDVSVKSDSTMDGEGRDGWAQEKRARTIILEEVEGLLVSAIPSMSAADKKAKADLLATCFFTRSWTAMEGFPSEKLQQGLVLLKDALQLRAGAKPAEAAESKPATDKKSKADKAGPTVDEVEAAMAASTPLTETGG